MQRQCRKGVLVAEGVGVMKFVLCSKRIIDHTYKTIEIYVVQLMMPTSMERNK